MFGKRDLIKGEAPVRNVPLRIFRMLAATGLMTIAALVALSIWLAENVNSLAAENSIRRIQAFVSLELDHQETFTRHFTDWSLAYHWISNGERGAVFVNIGTATTESGFFDYSYIYSASGTLDYAFEYGGVRSDLSLENADFVEPYLAEINSRPFFPFTVVRGLGLINGKPAFVTTARFHPRGANIILGDGLPIFVAANAITPEDMTMIEQELLITNLGFELEKPDNSLWIELLGLDGRLLGYLTWTAPRPGDVMLRQSLGITVLIAGLIVFGHLTVGRIAMRQTSDLLKERSNARQDLLTGLMNRAGFEEYMARKTLRSALASGDVALVFVDLDDFKSINDTYGHDVGDKALIAMAKRLVDVSRDSDIVVRLGGDEFVVLIVSSDAQSAAHRLKSDLERAGDRVVPITDDVALTIQGSVGVAVSCPNSDLRRLMLDADAEMYRAKSARRRNERPPWTESAPDLKASA